MTGAVWINGSFDGCVDPFDRGLMLGDGIFDTLVAFRRVPFAADLHLARLTSQADTIGIVVDPGDIRSGWDAVLARAEEEHAILRTTVTRGGGGRGLWPAGPAMPTVIVSAVPWNSELFGRPARLVTSTIRRNAGSPVAHLKSLGYLDNVLAAREAAEKGGTDALFLDTSGKVACTTVANIFAWRDDRLVTPPPSDGVMPGIMRALVLKAAEEIGFAALEFSLSREDLLQADAAFLTNSVRFICPVASLDGKRIGGRHDDAVTRLTEAVVERVRSECDYDPPRAA